MWRGEHGPKLVFEDPDEQRKRIERVRATLGDHGLAINPSSRFGRRLDLLVAGFDERRLSPALGHTRELDELLEANRDFAELALIVEELLPTQDSTLLAKLRSVLGGARFPHQDTKTTARDTQFELYIAALCHRAGVLPTFREPDCVISPNGVTFGLAAKRVSSAEHVRRLVHEGGRQLERAGLVGIVALSLDRLFAPRDERLIGRTAEELSPAARHLLRSLYRLAPARDGARSRGDAGPRGAWVSRRCERGSRRESHRPVGLRGPRWPGPAQPRAARRPRVPRRGPRQD